MGGFGTDGYIARTVDELQQTYQDASDAVFGDDLEPYEGAIVQALFLAFSRAVAKNQEPDLENLYDSLFIETASGDELTKLCRGYGVTRRPAIAATGVVEWSRSSTGDELVVPSGTRVTTELPDPVEYVTTEAATFGNNDTTAQANIKAVDGGTEGNVGADRVTRMASPPAGVDSVTNPQPVGDPTVTLTDGATQQTLGQDREDDEALRERTLESTSIGGAATVPAVRQAITGLDGQPSLTIYTNRTLSDNANGNGLPKLSAELVIYTRGATDQDIAQALHETLSIGDRLVNGINGAATSYTVSDTALAQDRTVIWSEPTTTALKITVDVVTEAGYAGDEAVQQTIAEYIGGTAPDGGTVAGLDVGEDVLVDELERRLTSLNGVIGVATLTIDATGDSTDDTTTRSDGLTAYEVAADEIATVNATDITVN